MHLYIALATGFYSWQTILKTSLDTLWKFNKTFYWHSRKSFQKIFFKSKLFGLLAEKCKWPHSPNWSPLAVDAVAEKNGKIQWWTKIHLNRRRQENSQWVLRHSSFYFYSVDSGCSFVLQQGQDCMPEHENASNHQNYLLLNNGPIMEPAGFRKGAELPFAFQYLQPSTRHLLFCHDAWGRCWAWEQVP